MKIMILKTVFLDIDRTLIHVDDSLEVIQIPNEKYSIHPTTQRKLQQLMQFVPVVLVTGRRRSTFLQTESLIPYTRVILEHGGIILPEEDSISVGWKEILAPYCDFENGTLWQFADQLDQSGFYVDRLDRKSSFWIWNADHSKTLTVSNQNHIQQSLPPGLSVTFNNEIMGVLPTISGKLAAVRYYLDIMDISMDEIAFAGDDLNDLDLLPHAGWSYTFDNAHPKARTIVSEKMNQGRGKIVNPGHQGTLEILERLLQLCSQ